MGFGLMKRRGATAAVATALVVTLAACNTGAGSNAEAGDTPAAAGGGSGQSTATAWATTGGAQDMFTSKFDAWNSENPDRQFSYEFFANDAYKERIRTAVGSGHAPTLIFSWAGGPLIEYVNNDKVVDLTDGAHDLIERLIPSVAKNGQVDGRTYAVPNNNVQPVMMYCNQEVLDAAGTAVPTTYDEMLDMIAKVKEHGEIPFAIAGQSQWPYLMWIAYLTDRIGGPEAFQAVVEGQPGAWDNPAILEAVTRVRELVDAGAFGDTFGSVTADQQGDTALVATGRAACVLHGAWVYPDFLISAPELVEAGKLVYAPFPAVEGGVGDPRNITGNPANFWSVSADATEADQQTALDFIGEHVLDDATIDELLAGGMVPPVTGLTDRITALPDHDYLLFQYQLVSDAPNFQLSWDQALPGAEAQALLTNLSQVFLGQITPEQFVTNMDAAQ